MVKLKRTLAALATGLLLGLSMQSSAIVISLQPDFQLAEPGEIVIVSVFASDFGSTGVGGWDIDLTWDINALELFAVSASGALGIPDLETVRGLSSPAANVIDVFEFSLLPELDLRALQGAEPIPLATFAFEVLVLAEGIITSLDLSVDSVAAADGTEYTDVVTKGGFVRNIPIPGTLALFALGLLGMRLQKLRSGKI